jgi:ankyrin repeat protein
LVRAIENDRVEVAELLLKVPSIDPTARENMALITASIYEYVDIVELLLEDGRSNPIEPCHEVDLYGQVIGSDLDHRVYFPANDDLILRCAAACGNDKIIELALKHATVRPGVFDNVAIIEASANRHSKVVSLLMKHEDVDASA